MIVDQVFEILKETLEREKRSEYPDLGISLSAGSGREREEIQRREKR